jgi:MFS family permease
MLTLTTTKRSDSGGGRGAIATWALAVAQLVSWGSIYYAFSLFVVPMEGALGWSRTATNTALSVGLLISGLAAYPVGTWIDHGHGRRVMVCGTVLAAAMLALWSQAHSLITLFVVWIGLGVAMAATLYDPVFAVITRDFPRSFRTKITLVTLVAGFASTVFIPLTQVLVDRLQWRDALRALAGFNLAICLPIHIFAIGRDTPREDDRDYKAALKATNAAATGRALRTPTFWALAVCFTAYYATFAALTFHLVLLMAERRVSPALILTTMAVIGPAQVLARVLWFTIGRNMRPSIIGMAITTAFPASVLVLIYGRSLTLSRGHLNVGFALTAVLLWSMPSSLSFAESNTNQPHKRCSCVSIRYPTVSSAEISCFLQLLPTPRSIAQDQQVQKPSDPQQAKVLTYRAPARRNPLPALRAEPS